jgi:transcriptional regulator with XRE-family HTH domain
MRKKTMAKMPVLVAGNLSVTDLRDELGLNRRLFSRLTGYSERAIAGWESGKELSEASRQRMVQIERLHQALARVIKPDFIAEWLQAPNDAFTGLKPIEVVERGEIDRIWRMIYELQSGMPG